MLKVITWNVNSIKMRITHLIELINDYDPDVILLQEIKCENSKFPHDELSHLSYNIYVHGQKTYNGVAILSKIPAEEVKFNFVNNPIPDQARYIEISFQSSIGYSRIVSLYVPNGGEVGGDKFAIKHHFLDKITEYFQNISSLDETLIIGADFNVAPFDIDIYDPRKLSNSICCTLSEKKKMRNLLNSGFEDCYRIVHPNSKEFSWWDYRGGSFEQNHGLRIDSILISSGGVSFVKSAKIDYSVRGGLKPSDHSPVIVEFEYS